MLFIFDWDGTLIDSTAKIVRCMRAAIAELGLPEREDYQLKEIIGLGMPEAIEQLFPGTTEQGVLVMREAYGRHFIEADKTPCNFYPRVMETLNTLKSSGHQIAVATGKGRNGLNRVLGRLDLQDFFHSSRCADETRSKPHPLMLHELLEEFSVSADQAIMVGDTEFDMAMAQQARVPRVAVSYGAHAVERLQAYEPLKCIDQMDELLELAG
jgi:phosphoglycolate phosphatase